MSLDMYAVGTALAGRFLTVTAPADTMGGTTIRGATIEVPNNIPVTPYVIVELPSAELTVENQGQRRFDHTFEVFFLFQKASGDLPRDKRAMLRWLGPLLDALHGAYKLGLAGVVMKSRLESFEPVVATYAGDEYHAWHLTIHVWTEDVVTLVP